MAKVLIVCMGVGFFCGFGAESAHAETLDRDTVCGEGCVGVEPCLAQGLSGSSEPIPADTGDGPGDGESNGQSDGGDGGDDVEGACFVPTDMHDECVLGDEIFWSRSAEERPRQMDLGALERPPRR
jgi:hypothetical protein